MSDLIYIVCTRMERVSGGYHYDPCVDPKSPTDIKMLACNDLMALQNENLDVIDELRNIADVVIVPVPLETYRVLEDELNSLVGKVDTKLDEAVEAMASAYRMMGIKMETEQIKQQMMAQASSCNSAGKVLNENLEIVERDHDYVVAEDDYDYDDDEYDDDDEYEDEDYEDDDELEEEDEDEEF